jgi:hypothetical protein
MNLTYSFREIKPRRMREELHATCMRETRNAYKYLVGRREGKRPFGRPNEKVMLKK